MTPALNAWPQQAFIISREILKSLSMEEVGATYDDMEKLGIAKLPYESVDVIMPADAVLTIVARDGSRHHADERDDALLRCRMTDSEFKWLFQANKRTVDLAEFIANYAATHPGTVLHSMSSEEQLQSLVTGAVGVRRLLIVLLATKNIIKETKERKLMKLGIGSKEHNRYTTTIKVGRITEATDYQHGVMVSRRPHLRRGHIRRQHYGPRNELVKQIFIEPVFVNADEGWISEREAYNVSAG